MDPKVKMVLDKVKQLTKENKLNWEGTSPKSFNPLDVKIGDKLIRLANTGSSVSFAIYDKFGNRIGIVAESVTNSIYGLTDFWKDVERRAKGVDETLDTLLSDLDSL